MSAPKLVATIPPELTGDDAVAFALRARRGGADIVEIRSDLHAPHSLAPGRLREVLPLLVSERTKAIAADWLAAASIVDRELPAAPTAAAGASPLLSHHSPTPLRPEEAEALWRRAAPAPTVQIKHVEPVGDPGDAPRLLETQARLGALFGPARVTVLAMGPLALPFRAMLSARNALEYVALEATWQAAPGQRLLEDARRSRGASGPRLGILGARISRSRSPRLHRQPFDRIDLPEDAPIAALLSALHPHYLGFAVTSPFKQAVAKAVGAALPAVNTLARTPSGWRSANTDVLGALAVLKRLAAPEVVVLGDGGATVALREAASRLNVRLQVLRRDEAALAPVDRPAVWTWTPDTALPLGLRFTAVSVAVIAYGVPAKTIAQAIAERGGKPLRLGPHWFIAQAREQRRLWEESR